MMPMLEDDDVDGHTREPLDPRRPPRSLCVHWSAAIHTLIVLFVETLRRRMLGWDSSDGGVQRHLGGLEHGRTDRKGERLRPAGPGSDELRPGREHLDVPSALCCSIACIPIGRSGRRGVTHGRARAASWKLARLFPGKRSALARTRNTRRNGRVTLLRACPSF